MTKTSRPPVKPARPPARAAAARRKAPAVAAKPAAAAASKPVPALPRKAPKVAPIEARKRDAAKASAKPGKVRMALVRDGFTMPAADFALVGLLKTRALGAQREAKKSELLRAGLRALAELDAAGLVAALNRLEPVKTGRPKKAH